MCRRTRRQGLAEEAEAEGGRGTSVIIIGERIKGGNESRVDKGFGLRLVNFLGKGNLLM